MRYEDENIWLTQKMMATLYDVRTNTVNYHIKKILEDSELQEDSVIRKFRITAPDGKSYNTNHYSLEMIIAVGFKVNSERAVQFRKWVNQIAKDYTIKGWVMDDERLKNGGSVLTVEYFDRLLEQIREIRLSERRFYQKITDIYATALDYDRTAKTTKQFFAKVQNKMHYAVHGHTAAELIYERADADKPHMGCKPYTSGGTSLGSSIGICDRVVVRKIAVQNGTKHMDAKIALADGIQECLETVQDIKACNQEEQYLKKLDAKMENAEKAQISSEMVSASLLTTGQMFLRLGLATVIVVRNSLMMNGRTSFFPYILFLIVASRLYDPLSGAMANMSELFGVNLQVKRLKTIQDYREEEKQKGYTTDGYDLDFDHVSFSYDRGKTVLKDVTFTAKQGQVTALVGPSGGGKSTVANLAAGFYQVDGGKITLGGTDISQVDSTSLMKDFSVVFQDVVLFNNTIMENIRVGRKDATDEEVIAAAKAAHCHDFIKNLPEGYQTVIGENGSTLSGGECQRLSIARALLKDALVILLDEATASLDVDNETEIQQAISGLIKGKTVLVIAHRMRTVENADQIVVLDGGVVAESGSHRELIEKNGLYARLVKLQTQSAEWRL